MTAFKRSMVLATAFVGLFAASARAEETLVAKIPFPFVVHGQQFPAGRYDIINNQRLLTIRGLDNRSAVFALAIPADGRDPQGDQPSLVFTRHENNYQLSQVWESSSEGLALQGRSVDRRQSNAKPVAAADTTTVVFAEHGK
jgi:hypothetical protein